MKKLTDIFWDSVLRVVIIVAAILFLPVTIVIVVWALFRFIAKKANQLRTEFTGTCTRVIDGDGFMLRSGTKVREVRIYGIDAPEMDQPYGHHSMITLDNLIGRKIIKAHFRTFDRYHRYVCDVFDENGSSVAEMMIKEGMAWHYWKYSFEDNKLRDLQRVARNSSIGIWSDDNPTPPWVWKRNKYTS